MMRHRLIALIAITMLVASLGIASAQGGGRGFGGRGGRMQGGLGLLRYATVQKELKMTPDQIAKIDDKQKEVQSQMQELRQSAGNFQDMSEEDRAKMMAKMQDIQHKAVTDILDEKQTKRFTQLELQRMGPMALARKDIAEKLKLTDDQKSSIADIQKKTQEEIQAAMEGKDFRNLAPEDRTKMQEIQKAGAEKLVGVLTDDQKKQWNEMLGDKFEFGPPPAPAARPSGA